MDHRRETRIVIGRNVADFAFLLALRVHAGISSADKPEDGRYAPLGPEGSEVLAGTRRPGFLHTVSGKVLAKRVAGKLREFFNSGLQVAATAFAPE